MDEEIAIIDSKTRREKIINFLLKNKKKLILIIAILVLIPLVFFSYQRHVLLTIGNELFSIL